MTTPVSPAVMHQRLQEQTAVLEPQADATLAALAAAGPEPERDPLEPLWLAAELAVQRGRLPVARGLLASIDALSHGHGLSPLRRQALERGERLAYLEADLEGAWQLRLRLRHLLSQSADPADQAQLKQEPLRPWRLELGADPSALRALTSLANLSSEAAIRPLADLAQRYPQSTAVAFVLLQRLRQAGWLVGQAQKPEADRAEEVPRRIWLLRRDPSSSPELEQLEGEWQRLHPNWSVAWVDHQPQGPQEDALGEGDLPELVRTACRCLNDPTVRGDLIRLAMVWRHGGLAPEWNSQPLHPLDPLLTGVTLLLSQDEDLGIAMELMAAPPQHPWVEAALEEACRNVLQAQGYSRWDLSGACHLSGVFARWASPVLARGTMPAGLRLMPLPELRQWLRFGVPIPRSAELGEEPEIRELLDQRQRQRAQPLLERWLSHRQIRMAPTTPAPPRHRLYPPEPAADEETATAPEESSGGGRAGERNLGDLDLGWLPLKGFIANTMQAALNEGRKPLILDAGSRDGRSACWLAEHWSDAQVVCLVQRPQDVQRIAQATAGTKVWRLLSRAAEGLVEGKAGWFGLGDLPELFDPKEWAPLLLHGDERIEGLQGLCGSNSDLLDPFAVVLLQGALQEDGQGRLLPQAHQKLLAQAGYELRRSGGVLVAFQRGRLRSPSLPIEANAAETGIEGELQLEGGVVAFDGEWQTPAITEQWAYQLARQRLGAQENLLYVGFPWASLIDHLQNGTIWGKMLLEQLHELIPHMGDRPRRVTVCQHIYCMEYRWLFELAGITDLFWPHTTAHNPIPGIKLHPFPLYPVNWKKPQKKEPRPILYSFIGAKSTRLYLSNSRNLIIEDLKNLPGSLIEGNDEWFYHRTVYSHQIHRELANANPHVYGESRETKQQKLQQQYLECLLSSLFSLCPSGTGPNTIRLWEAIGCGSIPVILSDTWKPPGPRNLWDDAAFFVADTPEGVLSVPRLTKAWAADKNLLKSKRKALKELWQCYGPKSFITDIELIARGA